MTNGTDIFLEVDVLSLTNRTDCSNDHIINIDDEASTFD